MKNYIHALVLLIATAVSSNAQSFTVKGPRTVSDLAADKSKKYTFFNLDQGREVAAADSNSTKWDIAFNSTTIIVNSGVSGPGTVSAQVLSGTSFTTLKNAPQTGYAVDAKDDKGKNVYAIPAGSENGWYKYNSVNHAPPHSITPIADRIIVVKLADGRYAKIQILNYYKGAPQDVPTESNTTYKGIGAYYQFKYLISEKASTDVSTNVTEVKNLNAAGTQYQYFNFTSADTIATADSGTEKWDVAFKSTTILVNSGSSGTSTVTAQIISDISFDGLTVAPVTGYKADGEVKVIEAKSEKGWYVYNSVNHGGPHSITPIAGRIVVLKLADGRYVKLQILNYYKGAPENIPVTGSATYDGVGSYYTFRYTISAAGSADVTTDADDEKPVLPTSVFTSTTKTITIYPNPISSSENKLSIVSEMSSGTVKIVDVLGNEVYTSAISQNESELTNMNLAKGFYVVLVESNGTVYQQKLVVE